MGIIMNNGCYWSKLERWSVDKKIFWATNIFHRSIQRIGMKQGVGLNGHSKTRDIFIGHAVIHQDVNIVNEFQV